MFWVWFGMILSGLALILYKTSDFWKSYLNFAGIFLLFILVNVLFILSYYYLGKFLVRIILRFKIFIKRIAYYFKLLFE